MRRTGVEVHAVARNPPVGLEGARWHAVDLFDGRATRQALRRIEPDTIVHLAWCAVPPQYRTAPDNLEWLKATVDLARNFAEMGGRRFVGIGTGAEYDPTARSCREDATPLRPADLYGATKVATFTSLTAWCRQNEVEFAWPRLFAQYGPGEHSARIVAYTIQRLLEGCDAICSAGTQRRDFLHVSDVGRAITHIALGDVEGPVNIGSGSAISVADLLAEVERQLHGHGRVILGERETAPGEAEVFAPDVTRLGLLGWRPAVGLKDGVADSIRWWRQCGGSTSEPAHRP